MTGGNPNYNVDCSLSCKTSVICPTASVSNKTDLVFKGPRTIKETADFHCEVIARINKRKNYILSVTNSVEGEVSDKYPLSALDIARTE
jgi:hypothetical protein